MTKKKFKPYRWSEGGPKFHELFKSCLRKREYKNFKQVERAGQQRMEAGAPQLYAYRCGHCGSFHLSHIESDNSIRINRS